MSSDFEIGAELIITSVSLNLAALSEGTGVEPAYSWEIGDKREYRVNSFHENNGWAYKIRQRSLSVATVAERLLDDLASQGFNQEFPRKQADIDVVLSCWFYTDTSSPIISFGSDLLRRIASLKADLDIDWIVTSDSTTESD